MRMGRPIQEFRDFRAYLRTQYESTRQKNPRWSLGAWARKLELSSTSSLTKVLDGSRRPGREMTERFKKYFHFDAAEARYFDFLVQAERTDKNSALYGLVAETLAKVQTSGPVRRLSKSEFHVISNWYTFAIRELLKVSETPLTPEAIAARFRFPISVAEVKESLAALLRVGLIARNGKSYDVLDKSIDTEGRGADAARRKHHEATLAQAQDALSRIPVDEREVQNISFVLKRGDFEAAREAIEHFRTEFIARFSGEGENVYRLQVQLFPLTQSDSEIGERP